MGRLASKKRASRTAALATALLLAVSACAGDGADETVAIDYDDAVTDAQTGAPETTMAAIGEEAERNLAETPADGGTATAEGAATAPEPPLGSGGITPAVVQTVDLGRDIIFTADLTVAVTDVATAGEQATRIIQSLGGYLFGQRTTGDPNPQSVLTFKVFPDQFQEALNRLGSLGELRTQNVSADDVTEVIVDLQSRINTAEASVERLRGFLEQADTIEKIAELENQLLQRETQLETLRGQLRTLEDQVALATIVLNLTEATTRPEIRLDVTAYLGHDGAGLSCPGNPGLAVDEGSEVTVCFELTNVGDTLLTDFEVRDPVLDMDLDDLIVVFGDPAATIEPGESILLAFETVAERDLRTQTTVTATPVAEDGTPLPGREAATTQTILIDAVDPGGIKSFSEGLAESWDLLVRFGQVLVLVAGWLVPFVWIPLVLWLVWRSRRRQATVSAPSPQPEPQAEPEREPVGASAESD